MKIFREILWPLVAVLAANILSFLRWHVFVHALQVPFTMIEAIRLGFLGNLFNFVSLGAVGGDLFPPEGGVGFRLRGVERAAVPEADVDENGEAVRPENKVGFHAERLQLQPFNFPLERSSSPPTGDAVCAHDCDQPKLGVAVDV